MAEIVKGNLKARGSDLAERIPDEPGIYLMKDAAEEVIYVGKARSLKSRVSSYFGSGAPTDPKTATMLSKMASLEYIVTNTEVEALILESTLVNRHRPRYNVLLKDDKHFPYLRLSVNEDYPRLSVVRRVKKDGAVYLGPFVSAGSMRKTLRLIYKLFPIADCTVDIGKGRERPCLQYQIGRCLGVCAGYVTQKEYRKVVDDLLLFLRGRNTELLGSLKEQMAKAAGELHFEEAARIRDQIAAVERVIENQRVVATELEDQDIIGCHRIGESGTIQVFFLRSGKILGGRCFRLDDLGDHPDEDVLSSFVKQFYDEDKYIPGEVVLSREMSDVEVVREWLSHQRGKKVDITVPRRGKRHHLVTMAVRNARLSLMRQHGIKQGSEELLKDLQRLLNLPNLPARVEAFDVSNLSGTSAVGSMVAFESGEKDKASYRRFRIERVGGIDDYAMMREIVHRRYSRLLREGGRLPDLIMIDGGKGHLGAAVAVLQELRLEKMNVIAFSKGRSKERVHSFDSGAPARDEIYLPCGDDPIVLPQASPVQHFLQKVRDEAHRFAIEYHKKMRARKGLSSLLDDVPGVGEKRKAAFMKHFGSLKRMREASLEGLMEAPLMTEAIAREILSRL